MSKPGAHPESHGRFGGPSRVMFLLVVVMALFIAVGLHGKQGPAYAKSPAAVTLDDVTTSAGSLVAPSILDGMDGHANATPAVPAPAPAAAPAKDKGKVAPSNPAPNANAASGPDANEDQPASPLAGQFDPSAANPVEDDVANGDAPAVKDSAPPAAQPAPPAPPAPRYPPPVAERGPLFANLPECTTCTLLVVVPTSYNDLENNYRATVRSTWGALLRTLQHKSPHIASPANATAKLLFFVGTKGLDATAAAKLRAEADQHNDLQLLDFEESYQGLSAKMVLIHEWIHDNRAAFPELRFVFKTDTDVWFNVPSLMQLVDKHRPTQTMIGFKYVNNVRLLKGKWANPEFSSPVYPQYMAGAGYLLSPDIASWVATNARAGWLKPLPNEDAVLGIWLAGSPVEWIHSSKFKHFVDPRRPGRITRLHPYLCNDDDILFHHLTDDGIRILHQSFQTCGSPCEATCAQLEREAKERKADDAERQRHDQIAHAGGNVAGGIVPGVNVAGGVIPGVNMDASVPAAPAPVARKPAAAAPALPEGMP
ncbi:UDP-Gal betaGal beta 1,3-galactosyltransferase, polypeptide 6 [Allomyces javanicus]|nr:UDP-Gal betaGal beta 1,3-galactosyltransferase, polypeptide 6 [Allomyces javanicus]